MPGSGYRRPPVGSPTSVEFLFCVLRWLAHSSVPRQGRTDSSRYSAARTRQSAGIARSWRSAPPIRTSRSLTKRSLIVVCFHVAVFGTLRRCATFDPLRSGTRTRVGLEVLCDAIGSPMDFVVGTGATQVPHLRRRGAADEPGGASAAPRGPWFAAETQSGGAGVLGQEWTPTKPPAGRIRGRWCGGGDHRRSLRLDSTLVWKVQQGCEGCY